MRGCCMWYVLICCKHTENFLPILEKYSTDICMTLILSGIIQLFQTIANLLLVSFTGTKKKNTVKYKDRKEGKRLVYKSSKVVLIFPTNKLVKNAMKQDSMEFPTELQCQK